jgi:hypothetical protein
MTPRAKKKVKMSLAKQGKQLCQKILLIWVGVGYGILEGVVYLVQILATALAAHNLTQFTALVQSRLCTVYIVGSKDSMFRYAQT